ncbi:MAG: protein kinase, partial [Terriglobales bacterium]
MENSKLPTDGKPLPKFPEKAGTKTSFAGESSGTGFPIPPKGELPRSGSLPQGTDPDATVFDAKPLPPDSDPAVVDATPLRHDPDATVIDARPFDHDPDATRMDARPIDPDATIIDTGTSPRRTPPPSPSQAGMYGSAAVLQIGQLLGGRYEILQLLGEGGMGAVYKATDRELDRFVALKVIRPELASNPAILARFKQELLLAHQVTHRNVIRIYDLGDAEGIKFITMEFIEGKDLRSLIREKQKYAPEEAVDVIQQVCQALEAAHNVGVIHRDLKPQNIMQDATGRILVMDFGLARTL